MAELTVRMPALSATMEDAELISWLVDVGDEVRSGQPLAEVATDKVDMELESPYDGTVAELLVEPGQRVELGVPVAILASEEEDLLGDLDLDDGGSSAAPAVAADVEAEEPSAAEEQPSGAPRRPASLPLAPPPVRKRAKHLGIDLHDVTATGSRGQVTHKDLSAYVESQGTDLAGPAQEQPPATAPAADAPPSSRPTARSAPADRTVGKRDRRRAIRLATARTVIRSAAVPQFTLHRQIDVTLVRERRGERSWTTELARALAAALWRHPECNAVWDAEREEAVPLGTVRIGIAVDTDDGLVVIGIDDPDEVDPDEADRRVRDAIERARAGKLTPEDVENISSTISNLGGFGIQRFAALLIPPQPTILSVGRIVETPVMVDGRVRAQPQMDAGLTVDHRVADGADGARLLETFARRLEG